MRIVRMTAENFKKLKAVTITPDGNIVTITGRNEQGKSSILDAIYAALGGKNHTPVRPIRDGEESARVVLDLGEYIVTRKFTYKGTTSVEVKTPAGAKYPSPQKFLDKLLGAYTFNPVEFLAAKNQREILLKVVEFAPAWDAWGDVMGEESEEARADPLAFIEAARARLYSDRRDIGRDVSMVRAAVETLRSEATAPVGEPVEMAELIRERDAAGEINNRILHAKTETDNIRRQIAAAESHIAQLTATLAELKTGLTKAADLATATPVDLLPLNDQIASAQKRNSDIAVAAARAQALKTREAELADYEKKHNDVDGKISFIDLFKKTLLENAKMPVQGIGFDLDGNITLDGIPFSQASGAVRLRTSVAIAMAANPELRIMLIDDAEKMDKSNMEILAQLAEEHDYQIWLTRVDESGEIGIVIEDGSVRVA